MFGKNYSPAQLALITALLVSVAVGICFLFFRILWWHALIAEAFVFLCSFLVFREVLRRFVYRKIKLIYKFIYQTKANKREEFFYKNVLPQKTIEEVEEDVQEWANKNHEEMELLRANEQYRKEFLQNFSHEIKTPIFSIQGYLNTLLSGALEDEELSVKFLTNAARNIDRMVNLVNDIDEISRLESGTQPLHKTGFVIQDLIKEVFESLQMPMSEKAIKSSIKKGCEAPITVVADHEKIRQVLTNLVVNAIKYGTQNGHITASVYKMGDSRVLIEMSDDGIGIAEEHLPRIFERFYRTDTGRSRNSGGTGLGLAICKHIVEAHNQTIHIRSKPTVGTTVGFTLQLKGK
ncbi:two-component sensor histidine kinase [Arachidicoccus ginsenosidimutans]|uniref:sensor histidine kinase n=1 Tax=Arachidicoccus sp. BS20 TaxID=1850526 RepID=UPI0007F0BA97|nr:ATP-binding protein [Arachidicoccus sp. BS20]ANI88997.1 two-component sensor histidine kinase [Arachidicoccus sp. BS20]